MPELSVRERINHAMIDHLLPRLPRRHALTMVYLMRGSNPNLVCELSPFTLAKRINCKVETAVEILDELQAWKVIEPSELGHKITGKLCDEGNESFDWFGEVELS